MKNIRGVVRNKTASTARMIVLGNVTRCSDTRAHWKHAMCKMSILYKKTSANKGCFSIAPGIILVVGYSKGMVFQGITVQGMKVFLNHIYYVTGSLHYDEVFFS